MGHSLDQMRRRAKALKKAHAAGDPDARHRLRQAAPRRDGHDPKHADFLHVIAREAGFESWPRLKLAAETIGLDRAAKQARLRLALYHGQDWVVAQLLRGTPDLAQGDFGAQIATYDLAAVRDVLAGDPGAATRPSGPRLPMIHLAFSRHIRAHPGKEADMLAIADLLRAHGADVNSTVPVAVDNDHPLSALYGAIGHAGNMALGRWLLDNGADPNDGESLYHATELGHHEGLQMLLAAGADPRGTNALLRAMDFHDVEAVRLLLEHGAKADDFNADEVGGEAPFVVPALHQAARRMCGAEMVALLLDHGADPGRAWQGASAYAHARVFGNRALARAIEARGAATPLSREERLMARAADGQDSPGVWIDPAKLPDAYRNLIRMILHLPGKLPHIRRLVALGMEYDRPDDQGLTPVQIAGWEGLPDMLAFFLSLKPDLTHVNGYGGTLLSTIVHGSETCPGRAGRDHVGCLRLALEEGVALPRRQIDLAGREDVAAFLAAWAEAHPGQVVAGGPG